MKLIRGAPGTGKTKRVFAEFKQALRDRAPNARIIVPTATLVRHFQHELARDGVVFSPRAVISLNRFIAESATADLVPEGLLRAIVRDALLRLRFPEFAAVAETEGMVDALIETINLFENAGATPEKLGSVRKLGALAKPFERLWRAVREKATSCGYSLRGDWVRSACETAAGGQFWFDGFLAFSPIELEFIRSLAKTSQVTITALDSRAGDDIRKFALRGGAEENLLRGVSRKPDITVLPARTLEREADEIARRIIALHEAGMEFRETGVALRDAATYIPLLKGAFERFGIPARFYFSDALPQHPAALFLNGLVSCALDGWDFETTLDALRMHPKWAGRADFDRFDFTVREAMPGHGAAGLLACCEAEWLREEIADCLKVEEWTSEPQTSSEWILRLGAFSARVYRPGQLQPAHDHTALTVMRSHVAAMHSWLEAISSVKSFWPASEPISLAEFWRVASAAVDSTSVNSIDDRANVVHVMNVFEARQWNISALFVCGMNDRDFPRQQAQNSLFPDADLDRLNAAGMVLRKGSDQERDEQWLFESLTSRASDNLFLSFPEHDSGGKSIQPSRFLSPAWNREAATLCSPEPRVPAAIPGTIGRISPSVLHAEMARLHESISLTTLEDLAQCRFKFFGGRTLYLKTAPDRPEDRLTPRVTGSILHKTLERWLADKSRNFVDIFEEAFEEMCHEEHLPAGFRLEVERMRSREVAQRVSAQDLWNPDSSEAEVPLTMTFEISSIGARVVVKCRIDRLDRFGGDCVIVDYKSSKTANVEKLVNSRTRLQGPLYALAVRENLHLNPVAMIYWAVREDKHFGWGEVPGTANPEGLRPMPENWANDAKVRTIERLSGFLTGQIHAHPEEEDQCRWCDFRNACRVEQGGFVTIATGGHGA
jgi:ATP-dependent helicase/DNAse subunit B